MRTFVYCGPTTEGRQREEMVTASLPVNICTGEAGVLLASAEMLKNDILPCRPAVDAGYDIVACARNRFYRVQVKTTQSKDSSKSSLSYRFNVCRRKMGAFRDGYYKEVSALHYEEGDVDMFVFVHLPTSSVFVVPSAVIAEYKHHISLRPECEYRDAWHLFNEQV